MSDRHIRKELPVEILRTYNHRVTHHDGEIVAFTMVNRNKIISKVTDLSPEEIESIMRELQVPDGPPIQIIAIMAVAYTVS